MNHRGNFSAFKGRLLIMAALALFAIIGYVMKYERNPITGQLQAVEINPQKEIVLGLNSRAEMARQFGGAIDPARDPAAARVAEIGRKLVAAGRAAQSPYANEFNFYLLNDPKTVNAFALPGGQIFITRALYDELQNEAQLAGVLGHEIGHVIYRHSSEQMAKGQLGQGLVGAVLAGSGDHSAGAAANLVNQLVQRSYGRGDELESDNWGLYNMIEAGYDPREMVNVMQILKRASGGGGGGPDVFQTHPNPDLRAKEIAEYVQNQYPNGVPSNLTKGKPLR